MDIFGKKLAIDLGTTNCVIWSEERGMVLNEPMVVAININNGEVVAVGKEARLMEGKTPAYLQLLEPLKGGVIVDYEVALRVLELMLRRAIGRWWIIGPEVLVAVPASLTQVEQHAVVDVMMSAGCRKVNLVDRIIASAIGARVSIAESRGNLLFDLGGELVEAGVITLGSVVAHASEKIGGKKMDQSIAEYILGQYKLIIGMGSAAEIKKKLGSAQKLKRPEKMEVAGRDAISGMPRSVEISSDEVLEAIIEDLELVAKVLGAVLEKTQPELAADIYDRGIIITGGLAQLKNLDKYLGQQVGIGVHVAIEPDLCAAKGVSLMLSNWEEYQRSFKS